MYTVLSYQWINSTWRLVAGHSCHNELGNIFPPLNTCMVFLLVENKILNASFILNILQLLPAKYISAFSCFSAIPIHYVKNAILRYYKLRQVVDPMGQPQSSPTASSLTASTVVPGSSLCKLKTTFLSVLIFACCIA